MSLIACAPAAGFLVAGGLRLVQEYRVHTQPYASISKTQRRVHFCKVVVSIVCTVVNVVTMLFDAMSHETVPWWAPTRREIPCTHALMHAVSAMAWTLCAVVLRAEFKRRERTGAVLRIWWLMQMVAKVSLVLSQPNFQNFGEPFFFAEVAGVALAATAAVCTLCPGDVPFWRDEGEVLPREPSIHKHGSLIGVLYREREDEAGSVHDALLLHGSRPRGYQSMHSDDEGSATAQMFIDSFHRPSATPESLARMTQNLKYEEGDYTAIDEAPAERGVESGVVHYIDDANEDMNAALRTPKRRANTSWDAPSPPYLLNTLRKHGSEETGIAKQSIASQGLRIVSVAVTRWYELLDPVTQRPFVTFVVEVENFNGTCWVAVRRFQEFWSFYKLLLNSAPAGVDVPSPPERTMTSVTGRNFKFIEKRLEKLHKWLNDLLQSENFEQQLVGFFSPSSTEATDNIDTAVDAYKRAMQPSPERSPGSMRMNLQKQY
eukprot:g952.t1